VVAAAVVTAVMCKFAHTLRVVTARADQVGLGVGMYITGQLTNIERQEALAARELLDLYQASTLRLVVVAAMEAQSARLEFLEILAQLVALLSLLAHQIPATLRRHLVGLQAITLTEIHM
jgi:hypothetical protein